MIIEDIYEGLVFDEVNGDLKEAGDDNSEVEIFEPRELSIVLEETEESEAGDTEPVDEVEQVVTGTCTIGPFIPIMIETRIEKNEVKINQVAGQ